MTAADRYNLWSGLRDWPWDERDVPKPRTPHPEPKLPAQTGDWLTELRITTYPPAPEGWKLVQRLAAGNGMHGTTGKPLKLTWSLSLAYLHLGTAQGATAILHFKAGAKKNGEGSWLFVSPGYLWTYCTDPDCDDDRAHLTADGLREASSDEILALLGT